MSAPFLLPPGMDAELGNLLGKAGLLLIAIIPVCFMVVDKIRGPKTTAVSLPQPFDVRASEPIITRAAVEFATLTQLAEHRRLTEEKLEKLDGYVHKGVHGLRDDLHEMAIKAQDDREKMDEKFGELNKSVSGLETAVKYNDALAAEVRGQLAAILQRLPRMRGGGG